ncbi:hypothetical protein D049_1364A, partial [Vibrio parahaemolyticus VPTS-2010]
MPAPAPAPAPEESVNSRLIGAQEL